MSRAPRLWFNMKKGAVIRAFHFACFKVIDYARRFLADC